MSTARQPDLSPASNLHQRKQKMSESVFNQLREQLDQYAIGFPATKSGVEIKILKALFSEKEAVLFTKLTARLESPSAIAQRAGLSAQKVAGQLEDMARKGLIFRKHDNGLTKYSAIPLDTADQMRLLSLIRGKDEDQVVSFGF
jgi:DNA-binding MarR family transcriptional regulator